MIPIGYAQHAHAQCAHKSSTEIRPWWAFAHPLSWTILGRSNLWLCLSYFATLANGQSLEIEGHKCRRSPIKFENSYRHVNSTEIERISYQSSLQLKPFGSWTLLWMNYLGDCDTRNAQKALLANSMWRSLSDEENAETHFMSLHVRTFTVW